MDCLNFDYERRFSAINRLYNDEALTKLRCAHVFIVGIGGVGSWAAEAIARAGVGIITLIDLDNIAESNINRQIHALTETLGESKVEAMRRRIWQINPECQVIIHEDFVTLENIKDFFPVDKKNIWIIDAIDEVKIKAALIAWARQHKYPVITSGGAGAKTNPMDLILDDLNFTYHDALCSRLKSILKKTYNFPTKPKKMGIPAIFSKENTRHNKIVNGGLNCAGYGSIVTITATMGLMMAGYIINKIIEQDC